MLLPAASTPDRPGITPLSPAPPENAPSLPDDASPPPEAEPPPLEDAPPPPEAAPPPAAAPPGTRRLPNASPAAPTAILAVPREIDFDLLYAYLATRKPISEACPSEEPAPELMRLVIMEPLFVAAQAPPSKNRTFSIYVVSGLSPESVVKLICPPIMIGTIIRYSFMATMLPKPETDFPRKSSRHRLKRSPSSSGMVETKKGDTIYKRSISNKRCMNTMLQLTMTINIKTLTPMPTMKSNFSNLKSCFTCAVFQ